MILTLAAGSLLLVVGIYLFWPRPKRELMPAPRRSPSVAQMLKALSLPERKWFHLEQPRECVDVEEPEYGASPMYQIIPEVKAALQAQTDAEWVAAMSRPAPDDPPPPDDGRTHGLSPRLDRAPFDHAPTIDYSSDPTPNDSPSLSEDSGPSSDSGAGESGGGFDGGSSDGGGSDGGGSSGSWE